LLSGIIKCPICNKELHILGLTCHLKRKHNTNISQYEELRNLCSSYIKTHIAPKYKGDKHPSRRFRKGKTWEEIYGPEKAKLLKQKLLERNRKLGIFCEAIRGPKNPIFNPEIKAKYLQKVRSEEYRKKKAEIQRKLMKDPIYKKKWYKLYIEKTYNAICRIVEQLRTQGYRAIPLHHMFPVPDIIAIKDGKVFAVEVVSTLKQIKPQKYNSITYYDDVWWIVYNQDGDISG